MLFSNNGYSRGLNFGGFFFPPKDNVFPKKLKLKLKKIGTWDGGI
jgi:hypothetical protein